MAEVDDLDQLQSFAFAAAAVNAYTNRDDEGQVPLKGSPGTWDEVVGGKQPQAKAAHVQLSKLQSYVSEPASTLHSLRQYAITDVSHGMWAPVPANYAVHNHRLAGELAYSMPGMQRKPPPSSPSKLMPKTTSLDRQSLQSEGIRRRTTPSSNLNRVSFDNDVGLPIEDPQDPKRNMKDNDDDGSQMEQLNWDAEDKPVWWKSRHFWRVVVPLLCMSMGLIVAGVILLVENGDEKVSDVQVWRLCFFLAGLPFIWWIGDGCTHFIVWVVERSMFTWKGALYFAYAVRAPLANVLRAALALAWWAIMMTAFSENQSRAATNAYIIILKLWGCVVLFMTANLLKRLLAKMLASKFNKKSHMESMTDSLKKEHWLHCLLCPREDLTAANVEVSENSKLGILAKELTAEKHKQRLVSMTKGLKKSASLFYLHKNKRMGPIEEETPQAPQDIEAPLTPKDIKLGNGYKDMSAPNSERAPGWPLQRELSIRIPETIDKTGLSPPVSSSPIKSRTAPSPMKRQGSTASRISVQCAGSPMVGGQGMGGNLQKHPSLVDAAIARKIDAQTLAKMETYIRKNSLKVTFKDELNRTQQSEASVTELEAKRLAFYLWVNVRRDATSSAIIIEDIKDFIPIEDEATAAFSMLDADGDGSISFKDCITSISKLFEDRANLAATLRDVRSVVGTLETLIGVLLHIVFVFLYLAIFDVNIRETYLGISSLILAFSFMFGNSIKEMYENVVFLFIIHPFDVGDTLALDDIQHKVEEINLHFTCLKRTDGSKVWFPNQKLRTSPFVNLSASGNKSEIIKYLLDMETSPSIIEDVEVALKEVVDQNPGEFSGLPAAALRNAMDPLKLTLFVSFEFSHNGVDLRRCRLARNKMHIGLAAVLAKKDVQYTWPPQKEPLHGKNTSTGPLEF